MGAYGEVLPDLGHQWGQQQIAIDRAHKEDLLKQQSDQLNNALNDPKLNPDPNDDPGTAQEKIATRQALIRQRLSLLTPPEAHGIVGDLVNAIHNHVQKTSQAPPTAAPQPPAHPPSLSGPAGAPAAPSSASSLNLGAPPMPQPTFSAPTHPFETPPAGHPLHTAAKVIDAVGQKVKDGLDAEHNRAQSQVEQTAAAAAPNYTSPTEVQEREVGIKAANDKEIARIKALGIRPVPMNNSSLSLADAIKAKESGQDFKDQNGEDIDFEGLRQAGVPLKITPVVKGNTTWWQVGNQKGRLTTIGNHVIDLPETGSTSAADVNAGADLGEKNPGTTSTTQTPGALPGEMITKKSSHTPNSITPPAVPPPAQPSLKTRVAPVVPETPPSPLVPVSASTPPVPSLAATNAQIAAANAGSKKLNKGKPVSANVPVMPPQTDHLTTPSPVAGVPPPPPAIQPGMTLSQGAQATKLVPAIAPIQAQIYGHGSVPPLWTYTDVFDDPKARDAINLALTMNATPIPGTEDKQTTAASTLARAIGLTGWAQMSQHDQAIAAREAVKNAGPRAKELLNRLSELKGTVSSLRSLSGAPATESSNQTIIQESPVYNVLDGEDFRDRLALLNNQIAGTVRGTRGVSPNYAKWWDDGTERIKASTVGNTPVSAKTPQVPQQGTSAADPNAHPGMVLKDGPRGYGYYKQ